MKRLLFLLKILEIRTLNVKDPQYQKLLGMIKVGDTITAVATEALVAAVEPAQ